MLNIFLLQRQLTGHYGDVYTCRFFPSHEVILTGGSDTQLKIWSAAEGRCAATLTGHRAGMWNDSMIIQDTDSEIYNHNTAPSL